MEPEISQGIISLETYSQVQCHLEPENSPYVTFVMYTDFSQLVCAIYY